MPTNDVAVANHVCPHNGIHIDIVCDASLAPTIFTTRLQRLPYSSWRRHQMPVLLRPFGARSSHGYIEKMDELAEVMGITRAQLALAWVLHRGDHIVPIPGTRSAAHLIDNLDAADVRLDADDMRLLDELAPVDGIHGDRYPPALMSLIDR